MIINLALSAFSGLLTGLSFNSPHLAFFIWFSLVPFIYAINKSSFKTSALCGLTFGFCYYAVAIFWVGGVTKLGLIFLLLYLSIYGCLFAVLARFSLRKSLSLISLACLWVILEFIKEHVWCGFGWANLGYSQYRNFCLIQTADLWGVKFISFLAVMVNVLIWEVVRSLRSADTTDVKRKDIFKKVIFVAFIFLTCFSYSFYRLKILSTPAKEKDGHLEISIVQPNIPQELKWRHSSILSTLERLNDLSQQAKVNALVIFPEAAWPFTLDQENFKEIQQFIKGMNRDVLIGVVLKEEDHFYNSALLFNNRAKLLNSYRKMKLVPFGEYIPLRRFLSFISVVNAVGDMSPGDKDIRFSYAGRSFSVLICFEDLFPIHVVRFARDNSFLVNMTNDAWFGGEPQASQHLSIMTFRAIENRIPIIRSANTGISGWVSYKGKIEKFSKSGQDVLFDGVGNFTISLRKQRSFYNRYPEVFVILCLVFLVGNLIIGRRFSLRRK